MITCILISRSQGSVELLTSALRDQSEPTFSKTPPTSKMLTEDIEVLVATPPNNEFREAEIATAKRLGDRADSKDAKQLVGFTIEWFPILGDTADDFSVLRTLIDRAKGDRVIVLPDMPYFFQDFFSQVSRAHRCGYDVVVPRLKLRSPVFFLDGKAIGKDGKERHSRLGPNSCGAVGFVLDNDCEEKEVPDHGFLGNPIFCASFSRDFLKAKIDSEVFDGYELNTLILGTKQVGHIPGYVIHLELPWNPSLLESKDPRKTEWQDHFSRLRKLPKKKIVKINNKSWLHRWFGPM